MQVRNLLIVAALLFATVACKPEARESGSGPAAEVAASATDSALEAQRRQDARPPAEVSGAKGGAFAREPGFQLPVPVSTTPVRSDNVPHSMQVDPVGIRAAVMDGLEASGANVQVQVSPRGIVSLSGEVANLADLQAAHYLARAQPGVVEVDYRNLRVRQR